MTERNAVLPMPDDPDDKNAITFADFTDESRILATLAGGRLDESRLWAWCIQGRSVTNIAQFSGRPRLSLARVRSALELLVAKGLVVPESAMRGSLAYCLTRTGLERVDVERIWEAVGTARDSSAQPRARPTAWERVLSDAE